MCGVPGIFVWLLNSEPKQKELTNQVVGAVNGNSPDNVDATTLKQPWGKKEGL
jgi:hypothetical protein